MVSPSTGDAGSVAWSAVSSAAVDRIVGTWDFGCTSSGSLSARREYVFTKTAATTLGLITQAPQFLGPNCTGMSNGFTSDVNPVTYVLTGTRTTPDNQVTYAVTVSGEGVAPTYKQILLLRADGTLFLGNTTGAKDSEGYPVSVLQGLPGTKR